MIMMKHDGEQPVTTSETGYFGGCPKCGRDDGYLNLGPDQWLVCDEHKTKWPIGSNLFSCWEEEAPEVWTANAAKLEGHTLVEPVRSPDSYADGYTPEE